MRLAAVQPGGQCPTSTTGEAEARAMHPSSLHTCIATAVADELVGKLIARLRLWHAPAAGQCSPRPWYPATAL